MTETYIQYNNSWNFENKEKTPEELIMDAVKKENKDFQKNLN